LSVTRDRVTIAISAADPSRRTAIVERARHRGFLRFHDSSPAPIPAVAGEEWLNRKADRLFGGDLPPAGVLVVRVGDENALAAATRTVPANGILVIEWTADRVIPLENAIAAQGDHHELWVYARTPVEVPGALGALEHGADRVIVEVRTPEEVDLLESIVEGPLPAHLEWTESPVVGLGPAGVGDRVIVDTTSLLRPEEGLLVGSAAAFLFHVASEAVGSQFSRPRPFRVNAGAAHSYVLMADGTTRYLSELSGGDAVLMTTPRGEARSARVGRIKIERRPMVVVTADDGGHARTVFLQEAETVRLSGTFGRKATTEIALGDVVRGVRLPPARHLGREVEETIVER
jgi:3-dehydroquinate synthase II